jgi:hypothetical protein
MKIIIAFALLPWPNLTIRGDIGRVRVRISWIGDHLHGALRGWILGQVQEDTVSMVPSMLNARTSWC